jgi:hypothetical protein
MHRLVPALLLILMTVGCADALPEDQATANGPAFEQTALDGDAAEGAPSGWNVRPEDGATVRADGDSLRVTTGPHTVLWPLDAEVLQPPYVVTARLAKRQGRQHEAFGIVFGGDPLDAPENEQRYSYFLIRGDGSVLVRRREGAEVPVIRAWTSHDAVRPDGEDGDFPENTLRVVVGADLTRFQVNGTEVSRVPTDSLRAVGLPGLRLSHDLEMVVRGFGVEPGEGR